MGLSTYIYDFIYIYLALPESIDDQLRPRPCCRDGMFAVHSLAERCVNRLSRADRNIAATHGAWRRSNGPVHGHIAKAMMLR